MAFYRLGKYDYKNMYAFEELPKGTMFALSMNPYTGQVFVKFEKHQSSSRIALDLLKQLVSECEEKFPDSNDALQDYAIYCERREELERLSDGARAKNGELEGVEKEKDLVEAPRYTYSWLEKKGIIL